MDDQQVNEERDPEFIFQQELIPQDQTLINFDPPYKIAYLLWQNRRQF